jgi:SAM-dependent methyltransferase
MTSDEIGDHIARNRAAWNRSAAGYIDPGRRNWNDSEPSWGIWGIPESDAHILPDVDGLDVIELGCGTAYVSAWLARRGARPVGVDLSENQLATARSLQDEHDLHFPLIQGNAEAVPLVGASFDLAISEYGAAIWCDPYRWDPRGRPAPPARRPAHLPRQRGARRACHDRLRRRRTCHRRASARLLRHASIRMG